MWEVELISTDTIKPSSPTPDHLRTFKLSRRDQISPSIFIRILLFYPSPSPSPTIAIEFVQKLKTSLSQTLTLFYPLAGRINTQDYTVDCNDQGVDFLVAKVNGQMHDFLDDPDPAVGDKLLPCDMASARSGRDVLLAVQVNGFDCGGTTVGVGISHKLADGTSMAAFLNGWAAMARDAGDVVVPTFDGPALFPPIKALPMDPFSLTTKDNLSFRRFVFDAPNMARLLRGDHGGGPIASRPTRVEAVSALICRCYMKARRESTRAIVVLHAVCLRKRMVPPLPESSFGNLNTVLVTSLPPEGEEECHEDMQHSLERQLREALRVIDGDYIRELQDPHGPIKELELLNALKETYSKDGVDILTFSSWCRFPLYEVDFGWGRPIWVCTGRFFAMNATVLMDSNSGDGIEAWVCLEEEVMANFERDEELLSFVSLPSPAAAEAYKLK
ncbi:vinorine synthase-like protein [Cinnamomum micranthum f. kanehirae]|uniref:Vinorine synthase-like protein n=1 Tax=Cinnamomum micranthum f. kanehirae TaxID=337451 RepID=A0A443PTT0_9MAGN|nr:vinorine synthase-like protein [Cinnamomum micranthum f. kanehirae]